MHLLSCSNPKRVFNKYINEYIWVPCGECHICKNRKAAHYTDLLERERTQHSYCFFVTLTYSDELIPKLSFGDFCEDYQKRDLKSAVFYGNRADDDICIPYTDFFPPLELGASYDDADIDFFESWIRYGYLPIVSKTDVQKFLKRLNKYIHDKITFKYKNFRYFIVSEYGSTTFRPHYHGIFYLDNAELADKFEGCITASWQNGIIDCKPVENSACGYCAQYINKCSDLPYVYQNSKISPFFLCSRNPFIGSFSECPENDAEIVNKSIVTICRREKPNSSKFVSVPLLSSYQNRLFPKCPSYCSVTDSVRIELYSASRRFNCRTLKNFLMDVFDYISSPLHTEFCEYLRGKLSFKVQYDEYFKLEKHDPMVLFDEMSFNWLRRLYYFSRKVACQACRFKISIMEYFEKIKEYYSNKEMYLLKSQYEYQQEVCKYDCDSVAVMYPEYLFQNGISIKDYIQQIDSVICKIQIADADYFYLSNKKTHFKNGYLDSLAFKAKSFHLFKTIKNYFNAKKCNEALEALAA